MPLEVDWAAAAEGLIRDPAARPVGLGVGVVEAATAIVRPAGREVGWLGRGFRLEVPPPPFEVLWDGARMVLRDGRRPMVEVGFGSMIGPGLAADLIRLYGAATSGPPLWVDLEGSGLFHTRLVLEAALLTEFGSVVEAGGMSHATGVRFLCFRATSEQVPYGGRR